MSLDPKFAIIDLPAPSDAVMAAFDALPIDPYTPGGHRSRRFSSFKLTYVATGTSWRLEKLPHRPFVQSKSYNPLVGGVARDFAPLTIDPTSQIDAAAKAFSLDIEHAWQINVHQCRVITTPEIAGVSVPEGPHHDGHEFVMLAVFARSNITGGESQLIPNEGGEPFFRMILGANQALMFEDAEMLHHATDIEPLTSEGGHRDLWIVAFDKWDNRKYGPEYEVAALAGGSMPVPSPPRGGAS